MQPPTYAELQTFKKVSIWLATQAEDLTSKPPSRSVEDLTIQNPLDIFQRFPDGASLRTLEGSSRVFRRFAAQVLAGCQSHGDRKAAWAKVGVEVIPGPRNTQTLKLWDGTSPERRLAELTRDGDWFASQVPPKVWKRLAKEIVEAEAITVNTVMSENYDTDLQRAIEFTPGNLPKPLADLGVIVEKKCYRLPF